MRPPNILYIHSHDTGRYVQPYGHAVATPNIQRLAEEGVLFRQAFCAAPTCSPSRAALLTGMSPHSCGMLGLAHRGFRLNDYSQVLVHTLRHVGYQSILAGHQHIAAGPDAYRTAGYDRSLGQSGADYRGVGRAAAQFLLNRPEEPFFLDVGFGETHREFPEPHPDDDPRYCLPPAPLPDTPEVRRDMAGFKTAARHLDTGMGMVFDALGRSGLADNTVVLCTTDHGIAFPYMKCHLTDHGIGVMLILRGPAHTGLAGGKVVDGLVSHVDLFPTLCELAGTDPPSWVQGVSILPLAQGLTDQVRDEISAEVTYHAAYEPMRCVRTQRYKYIRRFDGRTTRVFPNVDDSPSKAYLIEQGWRDEVLDTEALYDLTFDPNETRNVAGLVRMAPVLADLRSRLDRWMRETDDPLLRGPVPAPVGALANPPDGLSPREPPMRIGAPGAQ